MILSVIHSDQTVTARPREFSFICRKSNRRGAKHSLGTFDSWLYKTVSAAYLIIDQPGFSGQQMNSSWSTCCRDNFVARPLRKWAPLSQPVVNATQRLCH